jgi:hypothetical protein
MPRPLSPAFLVPAALAMFAVVGLAAVPARAEADAPRGCATTLLAETLRGSTPVSSGTNRSARTARAALNAAPQAGSLSGRTMVTAHFALNYTLGPNVHRVKLTAADASLKTAFDSIRATLPINYSSYRKDSTVHARLDSMGAAHPVYVQKTAQFFERAWAYYDSLGMRMPQYSSASSVYNVPSSSRYAVDIADVNTASGYSGPYYGLTYPPPNQGLGNVLIENDFLYGAAYSSTSDMVTGSPVKANYTDGKTLYRNYTADWELGLKVTASHEFYHAVQYAYLPNLPDNPHAWYELSATGMEERLAPEVNDYFQYLPYNIPYNATISVLVGPSTPNYGNGIFHTFLTHTLGAGFDAPLWETLRTNGNQLSSALVTTFGSQARWDSLYAAYAAALSISGTPGAASSPLAFSPDMAEWPKPKFDTVPATAKQLSVPGLTFRVIRPPVSGSGIARLVDFSGAWRVDSSTGTGYQSVFFAGESLPVAKGTGVSTSVLVAANGSFTQGGQALLAKAGEGLLPTRNPVTRSQSAVYFLAASGSGPDTLRVFSESGRRIVDLAPPASGAYWSWNLKDAQGRVVPPGLYFFGTANLAPKPLVVQP